MLIRGIGTMTTGKKVTYRQGGIHKNKWEILFKFLLWGIFIIW